jgi:uncharacterized membrane protein (DUF4010 family)
MTDPLNAFHISELIHLIPDTAGYILITLALSFLIGFEREGHMSGRMFGGVRTFPIIGFCGYMMAQLTVAQPAFIVVGVLALGPLMWLSYQKRVKISEATGMTSEVSGIFTFLMGALVFHDAIWEATALTVIVLLLLELKSGLEILVKKIPPEEIVTFTRFLLISAVILPIVPNRAFTGLQFNPYHTWLIVVAISTLSYAAYVVGRLADSRHSLWFTAILGGLYSSTTATLVLSRRSKEAAAAPLACAAILVACGVMYFRLIVLLAIFNTSLYQQLYLPFLALGGIFIIIGWAWLKLSRPTDSQEEVNLHPKNPLELRSALIFAMLFALVGVLTLEAVRYFGDSGVFGLSFLAGLTDIDPFVMSLTQSAGSVVTLDTAARSVLIATASNNIMKGIYAAIFGRNEVRQQIPLTLVMLAAASLIVLFFI